MYKHQVNRTVISLKELKGSSCYNRQRVLIKELLIHNEAQTLQSRKIKQETETRKEKASPIQCNMHTFMLVLK